MNLAYNEYFAFVLVVVLGVYLLDQWTRWLNLTALSPQLPDDFRDVYDEQKYAKSQAYTRVTTRFEMLTETFDLIVFLAFWWLGGFGWLDAFLRQGISHPILLGLSYVGILLLASRLLSLPFTIYDTFVIEERFGFNCTTWWTFLADQLKAGALLVGIGAPLFALLLFLFEHLGGHAWWVSWLVVTLFSQALSYLAPQYILPLFHRFEVLPEGELKSAIQELATRCQFPLREVYQIDGSKRSTKTNAFFTGFGKNKRIALFDTLIEKHTVPELVAVLAHEIGHYRKKHIWKHMAAGILETGVMFFLLGLFLKNRALFDAFGVAETSVYLSLVLFSILFTPLSRILHVAFLWMSRRHEFEADAYAAEATGTSNDLREGLKKLAQENLSNVTPHWLYVFLNYSHPPMRERIAALGSAMRHAPD